MTEEEKEDKNLKKVEAALFISGRFLTIQELITLTDVNPILLKELLSQLQKKYAEQNSSIQIVEKQGMWKMDINNEHTEMINRLATGSAEFSKAEQGTLAIIAYKSPIKQSVVVKIRGNKAYDHIKKFRQLNLISAKRAGRTNELSLTQEFYDYFGIQKDKNL